MGKRKAGCVPVRRISDDPSTEKSAWEVMLVQSRWTPAVWLFPKGGVEEGETGKEAGVRETREEAGVEGALGPKLGEWHFTKDAGQKHKMWLLFVTQQFGDDDKRWKERKKRKRQWLSIEAAERLIGPGMKDQTLVRPELTEMLAAAVEKIKEGGGVFPPVDG